jgi:hypothetical protein
MSMIRSFLPTFYDTAELVKDIWLAKIPASSSTGGAAPKAIVNVLDTMGHMALDIIGLTGFDYQFRALVSGEGIENENELAAAFAIVLNHYGAFGVWDIIVNWVPILQLVVCISSLR